jgi:Fic family protein
MSQHYNFKIVTPSYDSELTETVFELERLRSFLLFSSSVQPHVFFQMKQIFHLLETLGSARIEGNHTTVADLVEKVISDNVSPMDEKITEIQNIDKAIRFIDDNVHEGTPINRALVSEIHKILMEGLSFHDRGEGDPTPGIYRTVPISISKSSHKPPAPEFIQDNMDALFEFIQNKKNQQKQFQLLMTAQTHHALAWIHPFRNGNGRLVRLLTYAMLISQGFGVNKGRILNPTAIFCVNREMYYDYLSKADSLNDNQVLEWSNYVLTNLLEEIKKIDRLLEFKYLNLHIIKPALLHAKERNYIKDSEMKILQEAFTNESIKAENVKNLLSVDSQTASYHLRNLLEKKMLKKKSAKGRIYQVSFVDNLLLRSFMLKLKDEGFVPLSDELSY